MSVKKEQNPKKFAEEKVRKVKWQEDMLPTMSSMVTRLTIFFCVATLIQLFYLNWKINQTPSKLDRVYKFADAYQELSSTSDVSHDQKITAFKQKTQVMLEIYVLQQRYHHANIALMSRIWNRYLGFFTGMIMALIGAIFILGKLEEKDSNLEGKITTVQYKLQTASPGIILAVLGVILISLTIITPRKIIVEDAPLYMRNPNILNDSNSFEDNSQKPSLNLPSNDE